MCACVRACVRVYSPDCKCGRNLSNPEAVLISSLILHYHCPNINCCMYLVSPSLPLPSLHLLPSPPPLPLPFLSPPLPSLLSLPSPPFPSLFPPLPSLLPPLLPVQAMQSLIKTAIGLQNEIVAEGRVSLESSHSAVCPVTCTTCIGSPVCVCCKWHICLSVCPSVCLTNQGVSSVEEFYKKHHRWTEGLISAAKTVGNGATMVV